MLPWPLVRTAAFFRDRTFSGGRTLMATNRSRCVSRALFVHQTRPTAAERFEDLIVQDGASDHGTTRNFGMRVKLIRGNEFDGLNARPGGRYSCRTLTWMSASGVCQKSVALNGRIGMGQPCCLRSGSVLVNAVHRIKRPF